MFLDIVQVIRLYIIYYYFCHFVVRMYEKYICSFGNEKKAYYVYINAITYLSVIIYIYSIIKVWFAYIKKQLHCMVF